MLTLRTIYYWLFFITVIFNTVEGEPPMLKVSSDLTSQPGVIKSELIFEKAPFPECHASTIAESGNFLVAAWFGGTEEKHPDVGIWVARWDGKKWTEPKEVANGVQHSKKRYPCWNPVLFQPNEGPLLLFYKVGPNPRQWWGMLMTSNDHGENWSMPCRLPEDILGPIKNKPVQLANGYLLCPSSTEDQGWKVHLELTPDLGRTWKIVGPLKSNQELQVIQPTILIHPGNTLQILCRSKNDKIVEAWSHDGGKTWSQLRKTILPNPNSGIDAVTLRDGRHLLVYNHTTMVMGKWGGPRSPLNVAVSNDGKTWKAALVLENEPGEYSYPAVIQTSDGLVHITYTWKRKSIKHVVIDPNKLELKDMPDGNWPE